MTRARRTRQLFAGLLLVSVLVVAASGYLLGLKPSASRDWATDQAVAADASVDGHLLRVRNVRDFRYDSSGTITQRYYDAGYDLDSLESAWFVLTTFSKKWRAPAHTFVSFGFADGRYLAISVEARRVAEEEYGILAGMFRRYELIYVLGDERDLIGRRVAVEGDATWLYPVRAPWGPNGARGNRACSDCVTASTGRIRSRHCSKTGLTGYGRRRKRRACRSWC